MFGFKKNEIKNEEERKQRELGLDKINPKKRKTKKLSVGKTIAIAAIIFILAIAAIIAIVLLNTNNKLNKKNQVYNPELARAMTYEEFTDDDAKTETEYVEFGAFYLRDLNGDGIAERVKGTCKEIGKIDALYFELNVLTDGYLQDGVITINGENIKLSAAIPQDDEIKENAIGTDIKTIKFNQINNGTQKFLIGTIRADIGNNINNYTGTTTVTLTGTHFATNGTETPINKVIELTNDWYGTVVAEIPNKIANNDNLAQDVDITNVYDDANEVMNLNFTVGIQEIKNQLLLKDTNVTVNIPDLNGYSALDAKVSDSNTQYTFNPQDKTLTIVKETTVDGNGKITANAYEQSYSGKRYNKFDVTITYPKEAYESIADDTVELRIPVTGYVDGYNNSNNEFTNPYKSNIASNVFIITLKHPVGNGILFSVKVGKQLTNPYTRWVVSKIKPLQIYNEVGEGGEDYYTVKWYFTTGTEGATNGTVMKESTIGAAEKTSDVFVKANGTEDSMANITTNVGIYFDSPNSVLGEDGEINVYNDETDELLITFNKRNWSKYNQYNFYKYETPVKHIRIETSATNASSSFAAYNIKELDDEYITSYYPREEFDNLKYIKSTLVGYINGNSYINTDVHSANYEETISKAGISISKGTISTQVTEKNFVITIAANGDISQNHMLWQDGIFLVKLPNSLLDCEINNVTTNNSSVAIQSYEYYEENGEKFIKIATENENPATFNILINCNISPDPRVMSSNESFILYAKNKAELSNNYYPTAADTYDVDGNLNTTELVHKSSISISLVSPNSLLTNQTITNYDAEGSITVAPNTAEVDKDRSSAKINIDIKNNYSNEIKDIVLLGRVPFEGNKYVINQEELGSTYSVTMNQGIVVPTALANYATVYYSTNGDATRSTHFGLNDWKTADEVTDWSQVKSYLIDLGEYSLGRGESFTFSYNVTIPNGLSYNDVSYSHHAAFFSLETDNGKYRTRTEPNKIGLMVARRYNVELIKNQTNKTKLVQGATYSVSEEGEEEAKTKVTNAQGKITFEKLYLDRTYTVKETKSPTDYELNDEEIKFRATENNNGEINVQLISGNTKSIQAIQATQEENAKIKIETEDEALARLKIIKQDQGTSAPIKGTRFKLTGGNISENGKIVTTNNNGEVTVKGLNVGTEYTLEEIKESEGYYLNSTPIKFTITNNNGTYVINVTEGITKETSITTEEEIPTANITIENEPIPTYDLELTKIKHVTRVVGDNDSGTQTPEEEITYLAGAKFRLYKDDKELGEYITDENGKLTITGLYQYVEEKGVEQTYTLKETLSPEGYAKVKDIVFKVKLNNEDKLEFIEEVKEGQTAKEYISDNTKVNITVEDSPSFKLIKKDGETGLVMPNTKFAIYNVDDGEVPARNSKGQIIGTKETINGREYYTVTTDVNGEISIDLPEGMYKAQEVEAEEKYDIKNGTYYFGIGASRELQKKLTAEYATSFGKRGDDEITAFVQTSDGDYIVGGYFREEITVGNYTFIKKDYNPSDSIIRYDAFLVRYNDNNEVIWATSFNDCPNSKITAIAATNDGSYVVGGSFEGTLIVGDYTLDAANGTKPFLIKYNSNNEVEGAVTLTQSGYSIESIKTTEDDGYIVGGKWGRELQLFNKI